MKHSRCLISFGLLIICLTLDASTNDKQLIDGAKKFFDHLLALGDAYDPKVADLYADSALIKSNRIYPGGIVRTMTIPSKEWKELIRKMMPLAKELGDRSSYSKVEFTVEGTNVRIKATRYSERKKYYSPYTALVGQDQNGKWLIYEEIIETRP